MGSLVLEEDVVERLGICVVGVEHVEEGYVEVEGAADVDAGDARVADAGGVGGGGVGEDVDGESGDEAGGGVGLAEGDVGGDVHAHGALPWINVGRLAQVCRRGQVVR
ncbi:hypothetical protein [Polyangium jinanense]|uniref:Uncharacterized protein n=1 Tax=Polyangium jinanense TaxID=2829994 RepID=A0A9X4AVN1_9BACT|nr:hypothetical protein [Polyangium jinanense]MDC3960936.1 hypothetical protein [Polyangium jinanense]MDC3984455.1 hypothetical protein [Polyangium jinanense]